MCIRDSPRPVRARPYLCGQFRPAQLRQQRSHLGQQCQAHHSGAAHGLLGHRLRKGQRSYPAGRRRLPHRRLRRCEYLSLIHIFAYVPMYGVQIAFKDFVANKGFLGSEWADPLFKHFITSVSYTHLPAVRLSHGAAGNADRMAGTVDFGRRARIGQAHAL